MGNKNHITHQQNQFWVRRTRDKSKLYPWLICKEKKVECYHFCGSGDICEQEIQLIAF